MARSNLINIFLIYLCATPVLSISPYFSSQWADFQVAMLRYSHCKDKLQPLADKDSKGRNDTEFLIDQFKKVLDYGRYSNDQLANLTSLMSGICLEPIGEQYKVSININLTRYNGTTAKPLRCRTISQILDEMYYVMHAAAQDPTKPMDFSAISFYADPRNKSTSFGLIDLINVNWIKSEVPVELACGITNAVKEIIKNMTTSSMDPVEKRSQQDQGFLRNLWEYMVRLVEPVLGLQKRLYWESANRWEWLSATLRDFMSSGYNGTRSFLGFKSSANATTATNVTSDSIPRTSFNATLIQS